MTLRGVLCVAREPSWIGKAHDILVEPMSTSRLPLWKKWAAITLGIGLACAPLLLAPLAAHAQSIVGNTEAVAGAAGLSAQDPRVTLAKFIRVLLSLLGIVAVGLVMYAGLIWMTAKGEKEKVEKAQKIMVNAVIGLAIILSALAITQFVIGRLSNAAALGGSSSTGSGAAETIDSYSNALGAGIVETHFPRRNAQDIARNVKVVVTFREAIDPASIIEGYAPENTAPQPLRTRAVQIEPITGGDALASEQVLVSFTPDFKTFVFDPVPLLGNASANVDYRVTLTNAIALASGRSAFTGASSGGYRWQFTVSTFVDTTPPRVESVVPVRETTNPRNILVQVNYSEPMLPTAITTPTTNLQVRQGDAPVEGTWSLGNQYQTSEFRTATACGTNSCGETIYCLPANASLTALVLSPPLGAEPPEALGPPYAGAVDMYGNALDGNGNGRADGPSDVYTWSFATNDSIVLKPPQVVSVTPALSGPGGPAQDVALDQPVALLFDTLLSASSLTSDSFLLHSPSGQLWFTVEGASETPDGLPTTTPRALEDRTRVLVRHGLLSDEQLYGAEAKSSVRSVLQNCFTPSKSAQCAGPNCCNDDARVDACIYP